MKKEEYEKRKNNFIMGVWMTPFLVAGGIIVFEYGVSHLLAGKGDWGSIAIAALGGWMVLGSIAECIKSGKAYYDAKRKYSNTSQIDSVFLPQKEIDPSSKAQDHHPEFETESQTQEKSHSDYL